jgi:DNA-binding CsgD family transcriptional regulator
MTEKTFKLTPKEIEIVGMIKLGLATKEISSLLNVSSQTIDKHRKNIRKKLGLSTKNINLTSFLQSL